MGDFCYSPLKADALAYVAPFCIFDLCKHLDYHDRLKAKAAECEDASLGPLSQQLPYIDSFAKETTGLSPGPVRIFPHAGEVFRGRFHKSMRS